MYFGIARLLNFAIGTLPPPVGTVMLMVCGLAKTPFDELTREGWPFLPARLLKWLLVTFVPALSLALT